jgi:hypothetical protein
MSQLKRKSEYESNVELDQVRSKIQSIIDDAIRKVDQKYKNRYRTLEKKMDDILAKYRTSLDKKIVDLNRDAEAVILNIGILTNNSTQNKSTVLELIRTEINLNLKRFQTDLKSIETLRRKTLENLADECSEIEAQLENFDSTIPVEGVYSSLINQPSITVRTVIGPISVNILKVEERYNASGSTLYEMIGDMIENQNLEQKYSSRSDALNQRCKQSAQVINTQAQTLVGTSVQRLNESLSKSVGGLLELLNGLRIMNNVTLQEMTRLFLEILGIDISIELGEADVSRDDILAEMLFLCDQPQGRDRLVEIAIELGFDPQRFDGMSSREICQILTTESFI